MHFPGKLAIDLDTVTLSSVPAVDGKYHTVIKDLDSLQEGQYKLLYADMSADTQLCDAIEPLIT